jgi:hypothetical protein
VIGSVSPSRDGAERRYHVIYRYSIKETSNEDTLVQNTIIDHIYSQKIPLSLNVNVNSSQLLVQMFPGYGGNTI